MERGRGGRGEKHRDFYYDVLWKQEDRRLSISSEYIFKNFKIEWDNGWSALERIYTNAAGFSYIRKRETKNLRKRRAFGDLLKALGKCGLSKHKLVDSQGNKETKAFNSELEVTNKTMLDDHSFDKLNTAFVDFFGCSLKTIVEGFEKIGPNLDDHASDGALFAENITSWKEIFESYMEKLLLDQIYDGPDKTITAANHLVNCADIQNLNFAAN